MSVAGGSSTGSKRPTALFGPEPEAPSLTLERTEGCRAWDAAGREYLDFVMALGAVALGYAYPPVVEAATRAVTRGTVGSLPPAEEGRLAALLHELMPWLEQVRFLKTGAEAVAAAVRLARVVTGRDQVLGAGYHGWLDWCSRDAGVPAAVEGLFGELPFNDVARGRQAIAARGSSLAAVVVEPVVDGAPSVEWLTMLREETSRVGAVLVFDEIKTGLRIALGGAAERWGVRPDLVVLGKALANGFPLALVGGRREVMEAVSRTWISSTLATESVALSAAIATVEAARREALPAHLGRVGGPLLAGFERLAARAPGRITAAGIPEMCHLGFHDPADGGRVARFCLSRGILFKRSAYNFVSLAHGPEEVERLLAVLDEALAREVAC
ncbi:MAG: aminotransferase class III-fold pyridoxal phosphate-dependent enzyme [Gemmatimonadales bacterium]